MTRLLLLVAFAAVAGCGPTQPTPVPTDPDSVQKLEEMQKKAARGEN